MQSRLIASDAQAVPGSPRRYIMTTHYIVEVPHQMQPSVWSGSASDIVNTVNAVILQRRQEYELVETLDQAIEYIGHDAHGIAVYNSSDEVLADLSNMDRLPNHQCFKARAALVRALRRDGVLDDDGLTAGARALAFALWREQLAAGMGDPSELELIDSDDLADWLGNRVYGDGVFALIDAARSEEH